MQRKAVSPSRRKGPTHILEGDGLRLSTVDQGYMCCVPRRFHQHGTGYLFPGDRTMNTATVFGGRAVRKDISRGQRFVLGRLVLLVVLSRIFLGMYIPQDILVGAVVGTLVMCLTMKLKLWGKNTHAKEGRDRG